ncbi:hypothetical protein MAR_005589 [Mya arenaria]|uniref:YqaJ viral recombinase domain-containing protein n=1 Tax=Mya arenaria TaxID=6604 RepID=A0ABY7F3W7_MYAAR|nr:hypothetical protein MAR_005589 [Mya arenaria]
MKGKCKQAITTLLLQFVDSTFPLFAATPDGLRSCLCLGQGLVEIKCCFKNRNADIADISVSSFYLDENKHLKRTLRYNTQVQFQMYVCGKSFCDFVVYTHKGIVIETIPYNPDFVNELISKCTQIAINDLLPEIIQRIFQMRSKEMNS